MWGRAPRPSSQAQRGANSARCRKSRVYFPHTLSSPKRDALLTPSRYSAASRGAKKGKGKPKSEEHKRRIREANLGKTLSADHCAAIANSITPERRRFLGTIHSDNYYIRTMNHLVAPSVLAADFGNLQRDIEMLNKSEADWIHFDVMDGKFVPNISFGFPVLEAVKKHAQKPIDTFRLEV